jgi:hypothetical protein
MRAIRVASAALLGLTALSLTAPAAHARGAETGFRVAVLPHPGEGGAGGFDLHEIGLGAALIAGSLGVAYRFSRRRAGGDDA